MASFSCLDTFSFDSFVFLCFLAELIAIDIKASKRMTSLNCIFPNNDLGSKHILKAYEKFEGNPRFRVFPSIRFEYFLTILKNSKFIIGNSSAGVREAPYYGVPTINIGTRQQNRVLGDSIRNCDSDKVAIQEAIASIEFVNTTITQDFGKGNSAALFIKTLENETIWTINHQKQFKDV